MHYHYVEVVIQAIEPQRGALFVLLHGQHSMYIVFE